MTARRTLIMTLPPFQGGVRHMVRMMADRLRRAGDEVTIAYYATFAHAPHLVAPSWRAVLGKRPATGPGQYFAGIPGFECVPSRAVGCWLPELEFSYYRPSRRWTDLIRAHDRHVVVGGTVLLSNPATAIDEPHLVWCATTLEDDRLDRNAAWDSGRRWLERVVVAPAQRRIERRVLRGPATLASISRYTRTRLASLGKDRRDIEVLPIPVDTGRFSPGGRAAPGTVGFAGRLDDARKNFPLLLEAMARAGAAEPSIRLALCGEAEHVGRGIAELGLGDRVRWMGTLDDDAMPAFFRGLDMLVIPSRLEGHAIVGIEAMACAVPVISTRCGGPEDYVVDGVNGYLTGHDAAEIAGRVVELTRDRGLRDRLASGARRSAEEGYAPGVFDRELQRIWRTVWNENL
jgi:glycosyltransferase involved in cell wall biosynthesis